MIDLIIRRRRPKCVNVHWLWLFLWRGRDETSRYSAGRISAKSLKDPISRKSLIKPAAKMYRTNLSDKHYTTNAPKNSAVHFAQIYQVIRFILFILVQTIRSWHKIDRLALSIIYPIISFLNWFSSNANDQLKKSREISFPFVGRRLNWTRPTMWFPSTWCNPPCSGIPRTFYFIVSTGKYWSYRHVHV